MKNGNTPAMAIEVKPSLNAQRQAAAFGGISVDSSTTYLGLTKREHFAGLAMQGVLSNPEILELLATEKEMLNANTKLSDLISKWSRAQADSLLAELDKGE